MSTRDEGRDRRKYARGPAPVSATLVMSRASDARAQFSAEASATQFSAEASATQFSAEASAARLNAGIPVPIARVLDVSAGGVLLELPMGIEPPALHASGFAQLTRGASYLERHARVVRVRWGGRDKGKSMAPAVALSFDDADFEAATRWERMITA